MSTYALVEAVSEAMRVAGYDDDTPIPYGTIVRVYSGRAKGHGRGRAGTPVPIDAGGIDFRPLRDAYVAAHLELAGHTDVAASRTVRALRAYCAGHPGNTYHTVVPRLSGPQRHVAEVRRTDYFATCGPSGGWYDVEIGGRSDQDDWK